MKLALISAGLFLLSYVAVNRGLGPHPWLLVLPLSVAIGSAFAARWLIVRRREPGGDSRRRFEMDFPDAPPQRHVPRARTAEAPPAAKPLGSPSGGKARKLF